jgi:hypothetical protein
MRLLVVDMQKSLFAKETSRHDPDVVFGRSPDYRKIP